MIKEILVGVGKCNKIQVKILDSTSEERREKFLSDIKSDYHNIFIAYLKGVRKVINGCEEVDINEVDVDFKDYYEY